MSIFRSASLLAGPMPVGLGPVWLSFSIQLAVAVPVQICLLFQLAHMWVGWEPVFPVSEVDEYVSSSVMGL